MDINFQIFSGPNIFAPRDLIWLSLDLNGSKLFQRTVQSPAFLATLFGHVPALREDHDLASAGENSEGMICQTLLSLVSFFLKAGGQEIAVGEIRRSETSGHFDLLCDYTDRQIATAAAHLAIRLFKNLVQQFDDTSEMADSSFSYDTEIQTFLGYVKYLNLGIYGRLFTGEARKRGIFWRRITQKFIQVGQGRYQRRLVGSISDRTSLLSVNLAKNKGLTTKILRETGLPAPEQRIVSQELNATQAAENLGFPVVVKPVAADFGNGVSVGLNSVGEVVTAFELAQKFSKEVIVESFITGGDYRLLVIDGNFVAAARRTPAHIVGDGRLNVLELIIRENIHRPPQPSSPWSLIPLSLDAEAERLLKNIGMTKASVPELGRQVFLRGTANLKTGGTAMDVTDQVHPDVQAMAIEAAAAVGLDFAGIDYLTPDVSRSNREVGGAICEVNSHPSPIVHGLAGGPGLSKIAVAYVDYIFPEGATGRVMTIAVLGDELGAMCAYMVAECIDETGRIIGTASSDGLFVDGVRTGYGDMSRAGAAQFLMRNHKIDTAIFNLTPGGVVEEGLAFDRAMVSVFAEPQGNVLKLVGEAEGNRATAARRLLFDVTENAIILSADDPLCSVVLDDVAPKDIYLVAGHDENQEVGKNMPGVRAVITKAVRNGETTIIVRADSAVEPVIEISRIPTTAGVPASVAIEAALYAVAVGLAFGISPSIIGDRLTGFKLPAGY